MCHCWQRCCYGDHTTESHKPGWMFDPFVTVGSDVVADTHHCIARAWEICHAFATPLSLLATVLLWIHTTESHEPAGISPASVIVGNGVVMYTHH